MRTKLQELAYDLAQELDKKVEDPDLKDSFRDALTELRWQCGKLADGNFHEVVQEAQRKP